MPQFYLRLQTVLSRVALLIGVVALGWLWPPMKSLAQPTPPPYDPTAASPPVQRPLAALAAASYSENCAPCHGATGASDGPTVPDLPAPPPAFADSATVWSRSPAEYFHTTKFGRIQNLMPPWGNRLSDEQIWQVVYYAWSLHTDQATVNRGADRYAAACAACHGLTGAGDGPETTGQLLNWSDPATLFTRSPAALSQSWQSAHPEQGREWSEADRLAVLDYIRTFSYGPPWESAYRPGAGVLRGVAIQGSANGNVINQVPVTLTAYINFEPAQLFTTTSDAAGQFTFDQLATDPGVAYLATVNYANVNYSSDIYQLSPLTPTATITLPVYDTTEDASGLYINRVNWLIDFTPGALRAGIIVVFGNDLDRTYMGRPVAGLSHPATIALAAPPGASEIELSDGVLGGRYQQVGEIIYDSAPVLPGAEARQVIYSYLLPHADSSMTLTQTFLYPVDVLNLLVTDLPGVEVDASDLPFVGNETVQGVAFRRWSTDQVTDPTIRLRLNGLLTADSSDPRVGNAPATGSAATAVVPLLDPLAPLTLGVLVAVVLVGALTLPLWRKERAEHKQTLHQQRQQLLQQLATLDDRHAIGHISDSDWLAQRAHLKSALITVAQQLEPTKRHG